MENKSTLPSQFKELAKKVFKKQSDYDSNNWDIKFPNELKHLFTQFSQLIRSKNNLKTLSIDIQFKMSTNWFDSLIDSMKEQKHLSNVHLYLQNLDFDFMSLSKLTNITLLQLNTSAVQQDYDQAFINLGKCLENLKNLKHLKFQFFGEHITGYFCEYFAVSLSGLLNLLSFDMTILTYSRVKTAQLEYIVTALTNLKSLLSMQIKMCYCHLCSKDEAQNFQSLIESSDSLTNIKVEFEHSYTFKNGQVQQERKAALCRLKAFEKDMSQYLTVNPKEVFYELYS